MHAPKQLIILTYIAVLGLFPNSAISQVVPFQWSTNSFHQLAAVACSQYFHILHGNEQIPRVYLSHWQLAENGGGASEEISITGFCGAEVDLNPPRWVTTPIFKSNISRKNFDLEPRPKIVFEISRSSENFAVSFSFSKSQNNSQIFYLTQNQFFSTGNLSYTKLFPGTNEFSAVHNASGFAGHIYQSILVENQPSPGQINQGILIANQRKTIQPSWVINPIPGLFYSGRVPNDQVISFYSLMAAARIPNTFPGQENVFFQKGIAQYYGCHLLQPMSVIEKNLLTQTPITQDDCDKNYWNQIGLKFQQPNQGRLNGSLENLKYLWRSLTPRFLPQ